MRVTLFALCVALTGCTQFPALEGTVAPGLENADFPALVPLETLKARAAPVIVDPIKTTQTLEARVASLRARARALQQRAVVDAATRRRMQGQFS
jgi:hypothetical protein